MPRKQFRLILVLVVVAFAAVTILVVISAHTTRLAAGQNVASAIRLSANSMAGIELISVVPAGESYPPGFVKLTFRNATGRAIVAFKYTRNDTEPLGQGYGSSTRTFGNPVNGSAWDAGLTTEIVREEEGDAPVRVIAIEFADGEIIGTEKFATFHMRREREEFFAGLRQVLDDVHTRIKHAQGRPALLQREADDLASTIDGRFKLSAPQGRRATIEVAVPNKVVPPQANIIVVPPDSHPDVDMAVKGMLQQLRIEHGSDGALTALAARLEAALAKSAY